MKLRSVSLKASPRARQLVDLVAAGASPCEDGASWHMGADGQRDACLAEDASASAGTRSTAFADGVASLLGLGRRHDAVALLAALRRSIQGEPSGLEPGVASNAGEEIAVESSVPARREEGAAQRTGAQAQTLLDTIPVPVFYKDRQGRYIGCNKAYETFLGCTRDEIIGKSVFDVSPEHLARAHCAKDEALFREGRPQLYESKVQSTRTGLRDVVFNKAVFTNEQGEPAGLIGAILDITERKQTEQKLKEALEFAEGVVAAIPDILFEVDSDGRYLQVWTKNPELLAQQKAALLGRTIHDVLPADQAAIAMGSIREADEDGASYGSCLRIVLPNGETRWFEHSVAKRPSTDPSVSTFLVLSRDVTERKQAEEAINQVRAHLMGVLQTIPDMVWLKDVKGAYLLCNHEFERLVGQVESDIVGKTDYDLFDAETEQVFREKDQAVVNASRVVVNEEWATHKESGERILLETRKVPVLGAEGQVTGVLGVARDITELNASRQKIHQMAFYDPLTSLPNRALFNDRLRQMIADAARHGRLAGVMLIDMDHFKAVNDTMGHPVGDELLCQAAERLSASVHDYDTVARLGGDEFAILLPEIRQGDDLGRIAGKILEKFNERFLLDGKEVFVSCSIGIALYPDDSADADDLVKYADSAMYFAKRSGRSNFRFYSKDLTASAEERLTLESELRRAIERGELELHYQPKVLLETGAIVGSEALLRWRHPKMGMIPPTQFIGIAEATGLIIDLGRWVLREASRTAAELNTEGLPPHKVAINLSAREFQSQDLPRIVADILDQSGCRPEWIEIEITESLLLNEKDGPLQTLSELRAMGISIAIDDFGTGYSALNYLARFPIDTLKIDRSFINSVDKRSSELVKAILSIAHCLGQSVVAEGVETVEQAAFLTANGCEAAQGFLYSRPVPKSEFMNLPRRFGAISLAS
jgi:diguanylate cyclase (GGDEF)-like protein/PAS domain S-box-containing protein